MHALFAGAEPFAGSASGKLPPLAAESALTAPALAPFSLLAFSPSGVVFCPSDPSAGPHNHQQRLLSHFPVVQAGCVLSSSTTDTASWHVCLHIWCLHQEETLVGKHERVQAGVPPCRERRKPGRAAAASG